MLCCCLVIKNCEKLIMSTYGNSKICLLMDIVFVFAISSAGRCFAENTEGKCTTKSGPCVFPFKYKGKTYDECTTVRNSGVPWCATKVNSNGEYVEYGNCERMCLVKWIKICEECMLSGVKKERYDGTKIGDNVSIDECKAKCAVTKGCVAIEYDTYSSSSNGIGQYCILNFGTTWFKRESPYYDAYRISECKENEFTCHSRQCVSETKRCDGNNDCTDDTDELGCGCSQNEFTCDNGECAPSGVQCDYKQDCKDGSDEFMCW